jgi:adenosylcobinamide-phosphate synthase
LLALILDFIISDPTPEAKLKLRFKLHPTVWMGKLTKILEVRLKNQNPKIEKFNGVLLAIVVIAAFTIPTYFILELVHIYLGIIAYIIIGAIILKFTLCIKLETDWSIAAAKAIEKEDLEEAKKYAHFSRRDMKNLTGSQIASAVIESMAENLTDFRLSPIFYYIFFGVPGAVAFRAINTLDGMIGFKDPEHIHIGWFSATLDTIANYIPARLATLLIVMASAVLREDYKEAWKIAFRDHAKTPSRNHGWLMAAMAGALRVRLEKPGHYVVGDNIGEPSPKHILRALKIRNVVMILFALIFLVPILLLLSLIL